MNTIWSDFARMIYHVEVEVEGTNGDAAQTYQRQAPGSQTAAGRVSYSGGTGGETAGALAAATAGGAAAAAGLEADAEPMPAVTQRRGDADPPLRRHDPGPCRRRQ